MIAILFVSMLISVQRPNPILRCHRDEKGALIVGADQWNYVHEALDSWKLDRLLELVHPKIGMLERVVTTEVPSQGRLVTYWQRKDHKALRENFRGVEKKDFFYDYQHPGYTYVEVGALVAETPISSERFTRIAQMKGAMLYLVEPVWKGVDPAFRKELNRVSPITYIRMFCADGRLWIRDIGSGWPAE